MTHFFAPISAHKGSIFEIFGGLFRFPFGTEIVLIPYELLTQEIENDFTRLFFLAVPNVSREAEDAAATPLAATARKTIFAKRRISISTTLYQQCRAKKA